MSTLAQEVWKLGFQISPIILTNGLANFIPGQMLPIVAITEPTTFAANLINGTNPFNPDQAFANFEPMPGSTLVENEIGNYPFANQTVAANAIIANPLHVSLKMICPAIKNGGYVSKLITFSALKAALDNHIQSGGTFTVATPAYIYTNCLLTRLTDISSAADRQAQSIYQFDFVKPLLTEADAEKALNGLAAKISGGLPITGQPTWSGVASTVGTTVTSAAANISQSIGTAVSGVGSSIGFGSGQ